MRRIHKNTTDTGSLPISSTSAPRATAIRRMATLLAALLVSGATLGFSTPSADILRADSTTDSINDAKEKKEAAQEEIDQAQEKIEALSGEADQLSADLAYLGDLSEEQKAQYLIIAEDLQNALLAKQAAIDIYVQSQEDLTAKKTEYTERISTMFEYQNKSILEILLESENLAGFFTNLELISLIAESDSQMIEELNAAMDDAALKSEYAMQEATDMQVIADSKQAELEALEQRIGETEAALEEAETQLSEWQQKEDELEQEAANLDAEIARLQKELEKSKKKTGGSSGSSGSTTQIPPNGQLTWPYPGDYTIYSGFGMRFHPVYKINKMHNGVDLGGSYGNPIVAADSGTVLIASAPWAGQNTGGTNYGNYIVIDHGNGMTTTYAHCKDLYVSVGDTVSAGQEIAACGSTGTSTGPHLHFEVRVNGTRVDPAPYIQ